MESPRALSALVLLFGSLAFAADAPPKVAASPAAAAKPAESAEIRGKVVGADGKPIAGATVRVVESKQKMGGSGIGYPGAKSKPIVVKTGDDGSFVATGLKGSMFAVRVEHPGLAPSISWQILPGASLDIQLRPGAFASGRVFDAGTRKPIAGASVLLWDRDASPFGEEAGRRTVTGEDGRFRIGEIPPGIAYAEVSAPAHALGRFDQILVREKTDVTAETVEPKEPSIFLRPGGRVAGRVTGADGKGIEGATVLVRPVSYDAVIDYASQPRPVTTDKEGRFAIEGVPADASKRKIVVSKEGFAGVESAPLVIDAGFNRADFELRLETGATLKFRLVDADDLPVSDTGIALAPSEGARREGGVWLDEGSKDDRLQKGGDGTFTLKALEAGTFSLTINPGGYEDIEREAVRLRNGETTDLGTMRLREGRSISGVVTDTSGQPVENANVTARWMDDGGRSRFKSKTAKTGANGRYKLGGLSDAPLRSLWSNAKGYTSKERSGGAAPGDTGVDFVLEKAGTIVGKVLLEDGTPPLTFWVKVHREAKEERESWMSRAGPEQTSTDPAGNFTLEGLGTGSVTLEAVSKGKVPARKSGVTVVSGQVADAGTLTLLDGRTVRGRVLAAADGSPVAGATILASQARDAMAMRLAGAMGMGTAMSDGDGSFEISGLESRPYRLSVNHPDWAPAESKIDVPEGEDPPEQAIRLSRGGTLTGTVRNAAKQPVAETRISLMQEAFDGRSATSGPDGRYIFEKLPAGTYSVMRTPDGDRLSMSNIGLKPAVIRDGETTVLDFDEAAKITVSGRILRSGKPVAGASLVFLSGAAGSMPTEFKGAESDAEGRYQVGLDKAGPYQVVVQVGGMSAGSGDPITIQIPDQPVVTQDIVVPGSGVAGRVIDGEGKPVEDAIVRAVRDGAGESSLFGNMGGSQPDGTWRIEGLEPGTYRITASAAGYKNAERYPIAVGAEDAPGVELRLERGRSFRGRVVDPLERPMPGAIVVVAPAGVTEMSFTSATSDINGVFVATAPGDGALDITAGAAGYGAGRANGFVPAGQSEEPEITLRLTPGGRVRVLVTGSDGKPVAGAQVVPRANPPFLGSEFNLFIGRPSLTTGPDGVVSLGPWTAGSYELTAMVGARSAKQSVNVTDGGESRATIVLP
jgi:protocatechuate 3,4-dioxygenase beta subunit